MLAHPKLTHALGSIGVSKETISSPPVVTLLSGGPSHTTEHSWSVYLPSFVLIRVDEPPVNELARNSTID